MLSPPKHLIIKADDFGRGPLLDPWRRFIADCLNLDAVPSIGIVGSDYSTNKGAHKLARFSAESYGVEFWNHSWQHRNLVTLSPDERSSDTQSCHQILEETIGISPIAYGAPFNSIDAASARDVIGTGRYRVLYDSVDGASGVLEIPRRYYISPEIQTQSFRPIRFHPFLKRFENIASTGLPPLVVLQVHPPYWTDECFGEFCKTLRYLLQLDFYPATAADYADIAETAAGNPPSRPTPGALVTTFGAIAGDSLVAKAVRDIPPPTRLVHRLKRLALFDPRADTDTLKVIEAGDGVGLWAATASTCGEQVHASAVLPSSEQAAHVSGLFESRGVPLTCEFKIATLDDLPYASDSIDFAICNDGLSTQSAHRRLSEIARVLKANGRLLLTLDGEMMLVSDALREARLGNFKGVLANLDNVFALAGRRAGVVAGSAAPNIWNDLELSTLAMFAGFQPMVRCMDGAGSGGQPLEVPHRSQDLLIRTDPSRRRGEVMRGGKASVAELETLIAAGAGAQLLEWHAGWSRPLSQNLSHLGLAVQAAANGGPALTYWSEHLAPTLSNWTPELAGFVGLLVSRNWSAALEQAIRVPSISKAGHLALSWLSGRSNCAQPLKPSSAASLLDKLWNLGVAAVAGDARQLSQRAEEFLGRTNAREQMLVALAGDAPDTVFGFTEAVQQVQQHSKSTA